MSEHIPIAFPDILSISGAQAPPPTPELDHALNEGGGDIDSQISALNTAPAGISVVLYTPSKKEIPTLTTQKTPPASSQGDEPLSNNLDDDNGSIWSMKNYGTVDWDHSGDEFDNIHVSPKSTRRRFTTYPQDSSHPKDQTILLPPEIPGSFKSFSTIERDKKAAAVRRDSNGRFIPKATHPENLEQSPKEKRKMPPGPEVETQLPLDVEKNSTSTTRSTKKRKISKDQTPSLPPSASQISVNRKETRILPPKFVAATQRRSSLEQVQNTPSLSQRDSLGKHFSLKETSTRPPNSASSSQHAPGLLRDSNGKFPYPKETPIRPPKPVTSGFQGPASTSTVDGARSSQQIDSQRKLFPPRETAIKSTKPAQEVEAGSSEALAQNVSPVVRDKKGRFAPKKQMLTQPPSAKFSAAANPPPESLHIKITPEVVIRSLSEESKPKPKRAPAKSPYFVPSTPKKAKPSKETGPVTPSSGKRTPGKILSCIPFPPLSAPHFGLIQEKLAHDPFKLLIAVTFLIRTHGKHAIPIFYELMENYPTPEALVAADKEDGILPIIRHLGLQNQRANTYQTYAKIWLEDPPVKGKRYPVRGYPSPDSGRDASKGEVLADEDEREAWEIGHMTSGPYAIDSWRIFCRDKLRGLADGWNGEGAKQDSFQPEWMRVIPEDKELRAYLRWMWLKEGFEWDPFTGEKEVASERLLRAAMEGRIAWDDRGGMRILDESGSDGEGSATD
jgi:hypothetical protein